MSRRSGSDVRLRDRQVGVRLSPQEDAALSALASDCGVTAPELLRVLLTAVVDGGDVARALYEMNGHAWYGRDLGGWDDPDSTIGRNQYERGRWVRQAGVIRDVLTQVSEGVAS